MPSSPWSEKPEVVADRVLRRVEVSKIARKLQNKLALAQFKTSRGWEDLTLEIIEPRIEEELKGRRRHGSSGDIFSDSSSSTTSEFPYNNTSRTLMSSPLKATIFSEQNGSGSSGSGYRKRIYHQSLEHPSSSSISRKRYRSSPPSRAPLSNQMSHSSWKENYQLAQSSPIKPRKHPNFTTSSGPNVSFFQRSSESIQEETHAKNFAAASDNEEELPSHSFRVRSTEPRTPPPARNRGNLGRRIKDKNGKSGEEGADLLLFLATSPSPANPSAKAQMQPPSTPPPKNKDMSLPSSMMTTPGGGGSLLSVFGNPNTPSQAFDFADFVNITPSPGQRAWPKTPRSIKTTLTVNRRSLNFDSFTGPSSSPTIRDPNTNTTKLSVLGMQLGGDLV